MERPSGTHSDLTRRGFTLVELVVVIALLAVVTAIAAPRFASASARSRLDAAASRVLSDISLSATSAQAVGASRQVVFDALSDQYVLMGVRSRGGNLNRMVDLGGPPYETNLISASFDGSPFLSLSGHGLAEFNGTINLAVGSLGKRIVLLQGASSMQVESLELNSEGSGDVMPGIRRVTGQTTVDAVSPAPTTGRGG